MNYSVVCGPAGKNQLCIKFNTCATAPDWRSAYHDALCPQGDCRVSLSVFDVFKIGIGPSSSHTMGPMNAARSFVELLEELGLLNQTAQISTQLYGSLALTGRG